MTYAKLIRKPKPNAKTKPKTLPAPTGSHGVSFGAKPRAAELRRTPIDGATAEPGEAATLPPKLKIGDSNDSLEREADAVAAEVMQMHTPEFATSRPLLSASRPSTQLARMPTPVPSEQADETTAPDFNHRMGDLARRGGAPLPTQVRSFLEPRFGVGLGGIRMHTDSAANDLARQVNARAFALGQDLFFGRGEARPHTRNGMQLFAHEVAHTLQRPSPAAGDHVVRRKNYEVDKKSLAARSKTYDALGNIEQSVSFFDEFMLGAKKYLGIEFTTEGISGGGSRLQPKRGSQSSDLRMAFVSKFEGGVMRNIDVVRETPTTGTTDSLEVLVDEVYAGKVFDVAQKLILESDVDISADTSQAAALASRSAAGADITVNPNLINSTYIHKALARTYDGFWVMLHELFHRAQNNIFEDLAAAQNETILKGCTSGLGRLRPTRASATWRPAPPWASGRPTSPRAPTRRRERAAGYCHSAPSQAVNNLIERQVLLDLHRLDDELLASPTA